MIIKFRPSMARDDRDGEWVMASLLEDRTNRLQKRIEVLEEALKVSIVSMASHWRDDFSGVFSDDEFRQLLEDTSHIAGSSRVEDIVHRALYGKEVPGE